MVLSRVRRGLTSLVGVTSSNYQQLAARYALPDMRPGYYQQQSNYGALCATFDGYRFNTIFEQLGGAAFDVIAAEAVEDLKPRGIYNPVPKIIDFYAKHTLTGRMVPSPKDDVSMLEDPDAAMPDGDLWVVSGNKPLEAAIGQVWHWSNLQLTKTELATNCATYGNCLLLATEEPPGPLYPKGRTYVEVLHPAALVDSDFDRVGNLTYAKVNTPEYARTVTNGMAGPTSLKQVYTLSRVYTTDWYRSYRNGQLVDERRNPHGFVPAVLVKHIPVTGDTWGLNCFAGALPTIHELCLTASVLGTNLQKYNKPRWMIFGATAPAPGEEIEAAEDMWFFPAGSKADTMIPKLGVQDAYTHIDRLLGQLERDYPELTVDSVGDNKRDVSGAGVRGLLSGLIRKGLDARERQEAGLKLVLQMAVRMGVNIGGTGNSVFSERISRDLDFEFHWPDILPMNRLERLRVAAEEKTLELQIVIQESQIREARKDPSYLLQLAAKGLPQLGGNTAPGQTAPNQPSQGTPAR
jgi:hypothetical protein